MSKNSLLKNAHARNNWYSRSDGMISGNGIITRLLVLNCIWISGKSFQNWNRRTSNFGSRTEEPSVSVWIQATKDFGAPAFLLLVKKLRPPTPFLWPPQFFPKDKKKKKENICRKKKYFLHRKRKRKEIFFVEEKKNREGAGGKQYESENILSRKYLIAYF